jgi:hypothetical protein
MNISTHPPVSVNSMKRIMSFDIGIKNMAYCVFDVLPDNQFTISDWNVLDLTETDNSRSSIHDIPKCNSIVKTKKENKTCGKKAKYQKNNIFFCEKHSTCSGYIPYKKEYTNPSLHKKKKEDLVKIANTHFLSIQSSQNKSEILTVIQQHFTSKMLEPIQIVKKKTADETDLISIGRQLKIQLNQIEYLSTITHVIIENQISPIANRMKTIQGMLTQYFIMVGNPEIKIEFISSANKLKGWKIESSTSENTNSAYRQHKKDSVELCSQFIEDHEWMHRWRDVMQHRKKDDYADSFLQGYWYIQNKIGKS